ncbi:class I SAM-dependent methyltransferase [Synechococcus sp. Cruz-9H2]|uniref:class I SAM-dependent methyltransferase n=1 Tax=unclassified Synechococcus TaxID=2626047 RepID=UPI0020CE829F|nr:MULTISPECIES: class I SAM-dependent methyltransferase [unclassified Synechococcus]MCP9820375.1 class I SAM-dependent methyltransferase [Synechococcus sp. Cruz-9H2]MCP9844762.1 class I SAM-dependent methyltransferase [Synechococcus sp. Edmonson 11F2]MCP9856805.1 class I SAM-dependent methyltransferase [Synechococcus sp. Cruz-9C9]MCP9864170.1 class I SAM-dependent methyltransferase [Synechococcus sp. Cruz-7E5]MCP9871365.1 class I SAM-dependent methyltransferase [Synechococcus sp. Cruz-7B9]
MSWDHGYYSHAAYTSGFYREMAPGWIDLACLIKDFAPGRPSDGAAFRYLDLGCGTGYGLCLLAALHPEGEFTGVDFLPTHIAQAERLAAELQLNNVRFLEADFLVLAQNVSPLAPPGATAPRFDYVAAHGVATWVVEPVQQALFATAAASLRPGGLFYCSYNCFPGWLGRTALHQLVSVERQRSDTAVPLEPIQKASATLASLLGDADTPTTLAQACPGLRADLALLKQFPPLYLSQEYANDGWQPLYVQQLHERCRAHKLTYAATAHFSELFPQLLPESLREVLSQEANPTVRELLVDLATNKCFRRDIFVLGECRLSPTAREERLAALQVRLQDAPPLENYVFSASYGDVTGEPEAYRALEVALADGPQPLAALIGVWPQDPEALITQVALLLAAGRLGLDRGAAGEAAIGTCQRVNGTIARLASEGEGYGSLAAARVGQAISVPLREQLLASGLHQGLGGELLASCVQASLSTLGFEVVLDPEGQPVSDPQQQLSLLVEAADVFGRERLPQLKALGVYPL